MPLQLTNGLLMVRTFAWFARLYRSLMKTTKQLGFWTLLSVVVFLSLGAVQGAGQTSEMRRKLINHLTQLEHKQPNMEDLPIHVRTMLIPIKIHDIIEKSEVLETTIRMQLSWGDLRLAWNPEDFGNISEIVLPGDAIWAPDVGILNSVNDIYDVVRDKRFEMKVESRGRVWWHPTGVVKTYCRLQLRYYPFDRQNCSIVLESPTLDNRFMNLTLRNVDMPVDTEMFVLGETWTVISVGGSNVNRRLGRWSIFTRVEFTIALERARIYHILTMIYPAVFLSMMQVLFFFVPATHVQRIGATTVCLLSVFVFQTVVVSQLPKTSTDVPLLAVHIFLVTFVSGLGVLASIFLAKFVVFHQTNHKVPSWLRRIPNPLYKPPKKLPSTAEKDASAKDEEIILRSSDGEKPRSRRRREKKRKPFLFETWNDIGQCMDLVLLSIAAMTAVGSPLILFIIIPNMAYNMQ